MMRDLMTAPCLDVLGSVELLATGNCFIYYGEWTPLLQALNSVSIEHSLVLTVTVSSGLCTIPAC